MDLLDVKSNITGVPVYIGYAVTGAHVPYVVLRRITLDPLDLSVGGVAVAWSDQVAAYCVGGSVAACDNLAVDVMSQLQGARIDNGVVRVSMGYSGAKVEGNYETQITIQSNQGGI